MIIDFHTHTFPEKVAAAAIPKMQAASHSKAFTAGTAEALRASMAKAGIDRSVVLPVATNPLKVSAINDLSIAHLGDEALTYFGCIHPEQTDWKEELCRIAKAGLKGIKIHPQYQGADIDDIRYLRIFEQAASLGLWVVTHAGDDIGFPGLVRCAPEMVQNAIAQVGDFPLILAHMGGWKNWDRVEQLAETKVYLDTAFSLGTITPIDDHYTTEELQMLSAERFCTIVRAFGAERILFGTDSPWGDQQKTLESIRALPLTAQEKALILGENAKNILKL